MEPTQLPKKPKVKKLYKSVVQMLEVEPKDRNLEWLQEGMQHAKELELATMPPYLTAIWTIKDEFSDPAIARSFRDIYMEEMEHMATACNILAGLGATPDIKEAARLVVYPGELPGEVKPGFTVGLEKFEDASLCTFMTIEEPTDPLFPIPPECPSNALAPSQGDEVFDTVGEFYDALIDELSTGNHKFLESPQISGSRVTAFKTVEEAVQGLERIKVEGEGNGRSPEDMGDGGRAHYYRFMEVYKGRHLDEVDGKWDFVGDEIPRPQETEVHNMQPCPRGGYTPENTDQDALEAISTFNQKYTEMVNTLDKAWEDVDSSQIGMAASLMFQLQNLAREIFRNHPVPNTDLCYGPDWRYLD